MAAEQVGSWRAESYWDRRWATLHEGHRVFARGRGPWQTIRSLTAAFALTVISALAIPLLLDPDAWPVVLIVAIPWAVVIGWVILAGRGRIRITTDEVHVHNWRRTRTFARDAIARVIHVHARRGHGAGSSYIALYIALLDERGKPLWRSPVRRWTPETIRALLASGREEVGVENLTRAQVRQYAPHLRSGSVAKVVKAILGVIGLLAGAVVLTVLIVSIVIF